MNNNYHFARFLKRDAAALAATVLLSSCAQMSQLSDLAQRQSDPKQEVQANAKSETPTESRVEAQAPDTRPAPSTPVKPSPLYAWNGNGRWVSHIEVDVDKQKARFFDGEHEIGWTTVASGINSYPTPTGRFAVVEKVNEKRSNLYGKIYGKGGNVVKRNAKFGVDPIPPGGRFEGAEMPYFLRVTGDGIGLHAGPIPRPGNPASHGCIRMPIPFAPILYEHVKVGASVSIVGSGPPYATYLAQMQQKAAKEALARARRTPAKPAEGQPATAAPETPTLAKTQPGGSSSAPEPDRAQAAPAVETAPVTAAQASAKAPATLAKPEAAPATTANTPPPAKEATAVATANNAPDKTASTAAPAPATPPAKPDATAPAPATAKTLEPTSKSPTTQPVKPDAAPAKIADTTPATPATPPAKLDTTGPAPSTAKTSEPMPKAPAAQPVSPPSPARTAPTPAVAGSTADHGPAVPQAPVNSPRITTQSAPEKEG